MLGGAKMELFKKLPTSFFEKSRPNAPKDSLKKVKSFEWSNEKEVLDRKYRNKKIIEISKKS